MNASPGGGGSDTPLGVPPATGLSSQSRQYLFHLEQHGIKLGLQNIRYLLERAGDPHRRYPTVHVAGTNGKGSVVAMVDAMARAAGCRVGRFTSPHLIDVTERFVINGVPMPEAALEEQIGFFRPIAERMDPPPTFFEMNTAIAFRWFAQGAVDLAVIEVGMGGRLDSTNVIDPLAIGITNIALDHMQYLGDTIEQIAFEKAGILKPKTPVVVGENAPAALNVIRRRADELQCPLDLIGRDFKYTVAGPPFAQTFSYRSAGLTLGSVPLALAGAHQGENAAMAVALAAQIQPHFPILDARAISAGLGAARWPCRLEKVLDHPPVILDAAHNPAGAQRLVQALTPGIVLLAVSADKDFRGIVQALTPVAEQFVFSEYGGPRALPAQRLAETAGSASHHIVPDLAEAIEVGLSLADASRPLIITGSIFTAAKARDYLTQRYGVPPLAF